MLIYRCIYIDAYFPNKEKKHICPLLVYHTMEPLPSDDKKSVKDRFNELYVRDSQANEEYIPQPLSSICDETKSYNQVVVSSEEIFTPPPVWSQYIDMKKPLMKFADGCVRVCLDKTFKEGFLSKLYRTCLKANRFKTHGGYEGGYPGNLAKTILLKDSKILSIDKYCILAKSDGDRYMLVLIKESNDNNVHSLFRDSSGVFLYSRSGMVYELSHEFALCFTDRDLFRGTVFECELVKRKPSNFSSEGEKSWVLQCFDCLSYKGYEFYDLPYAERMLYSQFIFSKQPINVAKTSNVFPIIGLI